MRYLLKAAKGWSDVLLRRQHRQYRSSVSLLHQLAIEVRNTTDLRAGSLTNLTVAGEDEGGRALRPSIEVEQVSLQGRYRPQIISNAA